MNDDYIAGFFDGEGSAMILTIRRVMECGILFRFRPVIRISQGHREVLDMICDYLGFGHVTLTSKDCFVYVCNGSNYVERFVKRIMPLAPMKGKMLSVLQDLIDFQRNHANNVPYSREDVICQLHFRDVIFTLNSHNRKNLAQKYPTEIVMREHHFVDLRKWQNERSQSGTRALNQYAQSRKIPRVTKLCACGCGRFLTTPDTRGRPHHFIHGHNNRKLVEVINT